MNVWNSLPPSVNFSSLSTFKRTICEVDFSEFLAFYFFLNLLFAFIYGVLQFFFIYIEFFYHLKGSC